MRTRSGFTLLEVLIAITLLVMATVAIYTAITFASRVGQHNVEKTMALNLAIQEMDNLKSQGYGSITATSGTFPQVGSNPVTFQYSVTVPEVVSGSNRYKTVTVTVTWTHLGAPFVESEQLTTIVSS